MSEQFPDHLSGKPPGKLPNQQPDQPVFEKPQDSATSQAQEEGEFSLKRLYALALSTRFFIDTGTQIFMPFLPNIAAGLGVDIVTMGRLVSLRSATGLISPLFGIMADRRGYSAVMRMGLLLAGFGFLLLGMSTSLWMAVLGMILSGLGTFAFLPTIQAYVSARLPYNKRGRGLGILEYAWALSGIVGLFLVGQLIAATSWRTPFFVLGGMLLIFWLLYLSLPAARQNRPGAETQGAGSDGQRLSFQMRLGNFLHLGTEQRSAWGDIAAAGLIMFSAMHIMMTYGAWLQAEYSLGAAMLGTVALVLGLADLVASGLVSLISDRVGKRRSVISGSMLALLGYVLLPVLNVGLLPAIAGLVLARSAFEFSLVSNFALLSEQSPTQRGKILTLGVTSNLIGGTLAGFTGPWSYQAMGVVGLTAFSVPAILLALLVLILVVREPDGR